MKEEFRMKKMVFSLALLLGGAGSVLAQVNADKVNHAVARNSKVNQMFVTTSAGDVKYYNTADLASVKFEGDKAIIAPKDGSDNDEYDASVREINFAKRVEQGENGGVENPAGVVKITEAKAWLESAYLKWAPFEGASSYNVYVDGKKIDAQLIRQYASYFRADVLGLKAGSYSVKVVPVDAAGKEMAGANTVSNLLVKNYNREGFAHFNFEGIGAYNNDGTLKSDAKILYITASTAKTVSTEVITGAKNKKQTVKGLQAIIDAYQKGYDTTPIAFRIIGKVSLADLDGISSSAEGLQIKGKTGYSTMNMTFEGVGDDATIYGFGFLVRNAKSVEFRNFAIMRCLDDAMSLDTKNSNIWIHHLDLFYGRKGSAADQAKGDGTVDIKGNSKYVTVAYNHFWDNGKSSMCGMKSETGENWITYHHNWFDHSDSRHARVRTILHGEDDVALLRLALYKNHELAGEETHVWLSEWFERCGIAIAGCLEGSGTCYLEGQLIISERALIAILIQKAHGNKSEVFSIGIQQHIVLIGAAFYHAGDRLMVWSLHAELHLGWFSGCTLHVFAYLVAILVVGNHTNLARFILHVVPAEAIAVQTA
jgi:pectate lyase